MLCFIYYLSGVDYIGVLIYKRVPPVGVIAEYQISTLLIEVM